jgi:hypothetical protein
MSKVSNHIGRRALLRGTALATVATTLPALPAFAARAPAPNCADLERQLVDHFRDLIAAGRADDALIAAEAEITRLYALPIHSDESYDLDDEPLRSTYADIGRLEDFIASTPARSLAGVAVKLRRMLDREVGIEPANDVRDLPRLLRILAFVHGTVGEPTHATRPLYRLEDWLEDEQIERITGRAAA